MDNVSTLSIAKKPSISLHYTLINDIDILFDNNICHQDEDEDEKEEKSTDSSISSSSDQRRLIFVSLIGAYQTWKHCSDDHLHCAIFLLPLRRKWLFNPAKYKNQFHTYFLLKIGILDDVSMNSIPKSVNDFIQLLKSKDAQGLVFWMMDDFVLPNTKQQVVVDDNCKCTLIKPFWYALSAKLCGLHCPISGETYSPLQLNEQYWRDQSQFNHKTSKYNTRTADILFEFHALQMIWAPMQEIIYQSNPHTLHPIVRFGETGPVYKNCVALVSDMKQQKQIKKGDWYLLSDYDTSDSF